MSVSLVGLVARRELVERGRDRSFLVSTVLTLLVVVALAVIPTFVGGTDRYDVGLADSAGLSAGALRESATALDVRVRVHESDRATAERAVRGGDLSAALVAPGEVVVRTELDGVLRAVLDGADATARGRASLTAAGLDPAAVGAALQVPPLRVLVQSPRDADATTRERIARVGTFVLYIQLVGYGLWVGLGVVEEKSSRVVEVLLAAVPARTLLAGKVLGIGLLGLAQLLAIGVVGLTAATLAGSVHLGAAAAYPIALVVGWFLLGYAFYATAMAAMAARVSRQEDLQNVTAPFTLLLVASFFGSLYAMDSPDSTAARVLAVVPPFSALVSPPRVAVGDAALWEVGLAVVLMLLAVAGLVVVAGRLYEGAVLRTGGRVGLREAWRAGAPSPRPGAVRQ